MSRNVSRIVISIYLIFSISFLTGCAAFNPAHLLPEKTAASFESRRLDNPNLKKFLEDNLNREFTRWPPASWDFTTLNFVAFYYHPDLDVARAQWDVARSVVVSAAMRPNPNLTLTPEYISRSTESGPWTLAQVLDIPLQTTGKRTYRINQAKKLSDKAMLNITKVAWQVRSRLRLRLLDSYIAIQQERILANQLALQQENLDLIKKRMVEGQISKLVMNRTQVLFDQTKLALQQVQGRKTEARIQLSQALGIPPNALDGIDINFDIMEQFPSPADFIFREARNNALLNRTDILMALREYEASQNALQLEIAKQYPDIHLGPGYSWNQNEEKWSLGLTVTLPVFNQNEGPIAEAVAKREEKAAQFKDLQAEVITEIDRAMVNYQTAYEKLKTADAIVEAQKSQNQIIQNTTREGEIKRIALLENQMNLGKAEISRLEVIKELQQFLGFLEDALEQSMSSVNVVSSVPKVNPRKSNE